MTNDPRTTDEIYQSMRDSLTGKITKLTNFTERSFNYIWTRAMSREIRELEVRAVVSELAGLIDYSGGPITESDLERLDIDQDVTADEINQYMQEDYLDEFIKIVGVSRLEGSRATGTVTFTTQTEQTTIPEGTTVSTVPDSAGDTFSFQTTSQAETVDGATLISDVPIQAEEVGSDSNIPANTIIRVADPPIGVKGVTNPESTTGGEARESNEELRIRAKDAVQSSSLGGTSDGIKGYLRQNVEAVGQGDVALIEFDEKSPPYVDVVVDGGLRENVLPAIEESRPTGIRHDLIRPQVVQLGFKTDLIGQDINTTEVATEIENTLLALGIGENLYKDELIRQIMNNDEGIINVDDLDGVIERVTNEPFIYDTNQSEYRLDYTYESQHGSISIEDKSEDTYVEGTDFTVQDNTGDGYLDTIAWVGTTPDNGEEFFVDYDVTVPQQTLNTDRYDSDLVRGETFTFNLGVTDTFEFGGISSTYQLSGAPFASTVSITDQGGTTYTKDTDWQLAPLIDKADEDTITYSTGTTNYTLSNEIIIDDVAIIDANGNIYVRGTDFTVTDADTDGTSETIVWDDTASVPADGVDFTVNYNGHSRHVRWDTNNANPTSGDNFTVTYDQALYSTEYDITETEEGIIRDASGDVYNEDTEYILTDCSCDGELSAILWEQNPASLDSGEEFYFSYFTEGDIHFGDRQKADPGTITVSDE